MISFRKPRQEAYRGWERRRDWGLKAVSEPLVSVIGKRDE